MHKQKQNRQPLPTTEEFLWTGDSPPVTLPWEAQLLWHQHVVVSNHVLYQRYHRCHCPPLHTVVLILMLRWVWNWHCFEAKRGQMVRWSDNVLSASTKTGTLAPHENVLENQEPWNCLKHIVFYSYFILILLPIQLRNRWSTTVKYWGIFQMTCLTFLDQTWLMQLGDVWLDGSGSYHAAHVTFFWEWR